MPFAACMAQLPPIPLPSAMGLPAMPEKSIEAPPPVQAVPSDRTAPGDMDPSRPRDPFWPVGHVPSRVRQVAESEPSGLTAAKTSEPEIVRAVDWGLARSRLDLRGVSRMGRDKTTGKTRFVAVIAGKLAEEGDTVSVVLDGQVYRWKIVSIADGEVSLAKVDVRAVDDSTKP